MNPIEGLILGRYVNFPANPGYPRPDATGAETHDQPGAVLDAAMFLDDTDVLPWRGQALERARAGVPSKDLGAGAARWLRRTNTWVRGGVGVLMDACSWASSLPLPRPP